MSRRRDAIERYLEDVALASFPILDYDRAAAEWHARERVRLETAGKTPPFIDGQIAAIASVHDLVLVTANNLTSVGSKGFGSKAGSRVKIPFPQGSAASSPASGTNARTYG